MRHAWQIWKDIEPYVLQLLVGGIALFGLLKDWEDYRVRLGRIRWALLLFTISVVVLTIYETHTTRQETRDKEKIALVNDAKNTQQITILTDQIQQEREENKVNSNGFRQSFAALYQKYSELIAKTHNEDLVRQLSSTQEQLKAAEAKFEQPKATLTAAFWRQDVAWDNLQQNTTVSKRPDGSVLLDVVVGNRGPTAAVNGAFTIRLCQACKFAKEPNGFTHLEGSSDYDRQQSFDRFLPTSMATKFTLEMFPPAGSPDFQIAIIFSCVNCAGNTVPLSIRVQ
jgi:cell division protein FtsL